MITKRTFVDSMNKLQDLDEKLSTVDNALKDLSPDFGGLYIPDFFDLAINVLQEAIDDKYNWLMYFTYERDWLKDMKLGDIEVEGKPIPIETWEDVYDFQVHDFKSHLQLVEQKTGKINQIYMNEQIKSALVQYKNELNFS